MAAIELNVESTEPMFRTQMHCNVLLATLDMPGRTMNVFSWGLMDQLEALLHRIANDPDIQASVLTSGKSTFLAGADLDMVLRFTDMAKTATRAELHKICGRLGRLFNAVEAQSKPMVAAINGLAFGGGLEFAMACHHRICSDDDRTELGLPEIKLGLMAAAGGTQRAPRLVGIEKGIGMLLSGQSVRPAEAVAMGLVDELASPADLVRRAVAVAQNMAGQPAPKRLKQILDAGPFDLCAVDRIERIARHFGYDEQTTSFYPAYFEAIRAVIEGAKMPIVEGGDNEMERFVDLMKDCVAGHMVNTLFINRQRADKIIHAYRGPRARFALSKGISTDSDIAAALMATQATMMAADEVSSEDILITLAEDVGTAGLRLLTNAQSLLDTGDIGIFIATSKTYGTAIEIVDHGGSPILRDKAIALARQLRATPYIHTGTCSLLAALKACASPDMPDTERIARMRETANRMRVSNNIGDSDLADVAAVVGGLFPAYAGGPFLTSREV